MKRREIIKGLTLLPFVGSFVSAPFNSIASPLDHISKMKGFEAAEAELAIQGGNLLKSIGVEPFVNCKGTNTIMGGSVVRPEVRLAMESIVNHNVQMDELAFGVGKRLAEITGAEWGVVVAGCAAGIKLVTGACLAGGDPEKLIRIPDLTGFEKSEVIIPRSSRNVYDHGVRNTGATVIMVDTAEELRRAISSKTAMIYMEAESEEPLSIENVSKIARPLGVPVFVDAASHILTIPDVHLKKGADVVAYSGGKGIKAPGCSGLLLGKKDILMSTWQASAPHHGFGRDNKLGREEHIGMLAAVEVWAKMDHKAEMDKWVGWLQNIGKSVSRVEGVKTNITKPDPKLLHHVTPYLHITWDPSKLHVTGEEVALELGSVSPRVAVAVGKDGDGVTGISLVGYMMIPGNDKVAGDRIYEVLSRKRAPKPAQVMAAPAMSMVGHWDLEVEFFSSKVNQQLLIDKQEGNWFTGIYKSDFSARPFTGSIEGSDVKIQCNYNVPGDRITTVFSATVKGDSISGDMDMHEYVTAKFTGKKLAYKLNKKPILVPKNRPQSS